jgi:hypothetical protein
LAGSAFEIGRVAGIGYIERASQVVQGTFEKYSYMPLSETDLHQMFAETIFAGIPEMNLDPVISTGIERVPADRKHLPPWILYPRLSHYLIDTQATNTVADPLEITKVMRDEHITYSQATPSEHLIWLQYGMSTLQQCSDWKYAIAGGERLTNTVTNQFAALNLSDVLVTVLLQAGKRATGKEIAVVMVVL